MEQTSIDLDYDVVDIGDVVEGVADALADVGLEDPVVEGLGQVVPIDFPKDLEVAQLVADLPDFVRNPHIVVDQYPMDEVVQGHHSFQSPNYVSKLPIVPRQRGNRYPIPMHGYKHLWHPELGYCMPRIMFQD